MFTTEGFVLEDINPADGHFVTTPKLEMGAQLKALHTELRGEFDILTTKISVSGDQAAGGDLLKVAYERTGLENRPKTLPFFLLHD